MHSLVIPSSNQGHATLLTCIRDVQSAGFTGRSYSVWDYTRRCKDPSGALSFQCLVVGTDVHVHHAIDGTNMHF